MIAAMIMSFSGAFHRSAETISWSRRELVLLGVALLLGLGLRLVSLTQFPLILHNDEMSCGIEAKLFLNHPWPQLFSPGWYGHPKIGFLLTAWPMMIFDDRLFGLRFSSVFLGMLSLLGTFLCCRRAFGSSTAIVAVFLMAVYHWHIHYSRTGFHYMQAACMVVWSSYFFISGVQRLSLRSIAASGAIGGLGLLVYSASQLTPVLVGSWLVLELFSKNYSARNLFRFGAIWFGVCLFVYSPFLIDQVLNFDQFNNRASAVLIFAPQNFDHVSSVAGSTNWIAIISYQILRSLEFFVTASDTAAQYGSEIPLVDMFLLLPFLVGLVTLLIKGRNATVRYFAMWLMLAVLFGSILTLDPPFSPHWVVVLPLVPIIQAVGTVRIFRWIKKLRFPSWGCVVILSALVASSVFQCWTYYLIRLNSAGDEPVPRRDWVLRDIRNKPEVKSVVSFFDSPDDVRHEAYQFLRPDVEAYALPPTEFPKLLSLVKHGTVVGIAPIEMQQELDSLDLHSSSAVFRDKWSGEQFVLFRINQG